MPRRQMASQINMSCVEILQNLPQAVDAWVLRLYVQISAYDTVKRQIIKIISSLVNRLNELKHQLNTLWRQFLALVE